MSRTFSLINENQAITAGDLSGDVAGSIYETTMMEFATVVFVTTGTHAGNIILQGSNDGGANWADANTTAVSNGATYVVSSSDWGFSKLRVFYDSTSGTGTGNAHITLKGW